IISTAWSPTVAKRLQMQRQKLDYFIHPVQYDTTQVLRDLRDTGIICPDLTETMPRLVQYYQTHVTH
ncbi:MAG: 3-beta hydroxysteroid dehydrogenase, partial [Exiguobacterium sp.]